MTGKKKSATRRPAKLRELTAKPRSSECSQQTALIMKHAHESCSALLKAFSLARAQRGQKRGMTTDEEQDLLRAMLVMGAAGLDAMAKQIIRDALPLLVKYDPKVRHGLERFVSRQLRGASSGLERTDSTKFLARILAAPSQQRQVIEDYIESLTGGSLQSPEELMRTANALGLSRDEVGISLKRIKDIFDVRNTIIHELDMKLTGDRRKRNLRRKGDMIGFTNDLLEVGENILTGVDTKVAEVSQPLP